VSWVKRMLLLAEMPSADSLLAIGYLEAVVAQEALDAEVARLCDRLRGHAPLTIAATRETCDGSHLRRMSTLATSLGPVTAVSISVAAPRRSALGRGSNGRGGNSSL
jgi:enoyl-CoA hydratase/carnithine racemase